MEKGDVIELMYVDFKQAQKLGDWYQGTCNRIVDMAKLQPGLPIYAMVENEVVAGCEYTSWCGQIDMAEFNGLYFGQEKVWKWTEAMRDKEGFFESEAPEEMVEEADHMFPRDKRKKFIIDWINTIPWKACMLLYVVPPKDL